MNSWLKDTMRPRHADGEISAMYMGAVTSTAPTPKPLSRRATISVAKFSDSAASSAEAANTQVASSSTVRRPISIGQRTGDEDRNRGSDRHRRDRPAELELVQGEFAFDETHGAGEQRTVEAHEKTAECDDQDRPDRAVAARQHHAGRPTESRSTSLGSKTCCTSRSCWSYTFLSTQRDAMRAMSAIG